MKCNRLIRLSMVQGYEVVNETLILKLVDGTTIQNKLPRYNTDLIIEQLNSGQPDDCFWF